MDDWGEVIRGDSSCSEAERRQQSRPEVRGSERGVGHSTVNRGPDPGPDARRQADPRRDRLANVRFVAAARPASARPGSGQKFHHRVRGEQEVESVHERRRRPRRIAASRASRRSSGSAARRAAAAGANATRRIALQLARAPTVSDRSRHRRVEQGATARSAETLDQRPPTGRGAGRASAAAAARGMARASAPSRASAASPASLRGLGERVEVAPDAAAA